MRFFPDGAAEPVFLSSGAEDYFLSASYFDEGMFKTPNSGLTYFDHKGTVGVYKTHDRDPVVWNDGMKLVVNSLLHSIPNLSNVLLVSILFYYLFGILAL